MDQIKEFLTKRNIIAILILAILAVGLLVGLRLVQQQTQLKSKAAEGFACNESSGEFRYCMWFSAADGGAITAGKEVWVWVVGGQDDQSPRLTGTINLPAASQSGPGSNCYQEESFKNCWKFVIPASQVTNKTYAETFTSELAPDGRIASSFTPQAGTPTAGGKVTIGGRVTNKNTGQPIKVTVNQGVVDPKLGGKECNIGTATTNDAGDFTFSNVGSGLLFCLRVPSIAGYKGAETLRGGLSYEGETATADNRNYDFRYIPDDNAGVSGFKILDQNGQDVATGGTIIEDQSYTFKIDMKNNGTSIWKKGTYKLQASETTVSIWKLATDLFDHDGSSDISPNSIANFTVEATAPAGTSLNNPPRFAVTMYNGQANFGQGVDRSVSVRGPTPTPAPTSLPPITIGGRCGQCGTNCKPANCSPITSCESWTDSNSICRSKGSAHQEDKCIDQVCVPPHKLGVCLKCWNTANTDCEVIERACVDLDPTKPICKTTGLDRGSCTAGPTPAPTPAPTVVCFVVSEDKRVRDGFRKCDQQVPPGSVTGILDQSTTVDFRLSEVNASKTKTIFARFLKLAQDAQIVNPLIECGLQKEKCRDTLAEITLNEIVVPPPITGCGCQADNTCSSPCKFTKLTGVDYGLPPGSGLIQCSLPAVIHNIVPTSQDKNSWCNRQLRTTGDADGNGVKDENDYLYWLTAVNLGKVPVSVNPDFDGDGQIDADDLTIWSR